MKPTKSILILLSLLLISNCGDKVREEITERYDNGQKKVLVKYKGDGENEQLIEKITYNQKGEKVSYQNFGNGKEWLYIEEIKNKTDIIEYLQNEWDCGTFSNDTLYSGERSEYFRVIKIGDDYSYEYTDGGTYTYKIKIISYFQYDLIWDNPQTPLQMISDDELKIISMGEYVNSCFRK
tara:strand:- start:63 stop:602 length:540 start_codon:yes stop_codon:yes gene_type:complete